MSKLSSSANMAYMSSAINPHRNALTTTYTDRLKKGYDGPMYEVVSDIIKGLSGKPVTVPGGTFKR